MPPPPKHRISTNSENDFPARPASASSARGQTLDEGVFTAPGKVYVFNLSGVDIDSLSLNGGSAGKVPAWVTQGNDPFVSTVLAVPRTLNASQGRGTFFAGSNAVLVNTIQGVFSCTIQIDNSVTPMNESLALYLLLTQFIFLRNSGVKIGEGPLNTVSRTAQRSLKSPGDAPASEERNQQDADR